MRQKKQKQLPLPHFLTSTSHLTTMVIFDFEKKEEFEDTKEVIRFRISKKNRQHNGQKKKVQKDKQRSTKLTTIDILNLQHIYSSNIQTAPVYGVNISQHIRDSRVCSLHTYVVQSLNTKLVSQ